MKHGGTPESLEGTPGTSTCRSRHRARNLGEDPARGEYGDERALAIRRDRVPARRGVDVGREAEQRIVQLRREVCIGGAAGAAGWAL
jgi:hypothetical protein